MAKDVQSLSTSNGYGVDDKTFVVGCRTRASAIFKPGEELGIAYKDESGAVARFLFKTRFRNLSLSTPVPEDLWVHATGKAHRIESAIRVFATGAQDVSIVLGLAANAWMGNLEPEVAFESTIGKSKRDFWQGFVPERPITVVPGRQVHVAATRELMGAIESSPWRERLRRASSQYHSALERWTMGSELMAVAHLFMAVEALKPVAVDIALSESKLTKDDLAKTWGFQPTRHMAIDTFLEATARRRQIFQGDDDCHRTAKKVSDAFEHGLVNSGKLADDAASVAAKVATYTRAFILSASGLSAPTKELFLSAPYDKPLGPLDLLYCFRGVLEGEGETYAPPSQVYPIMKWKHTLDEVVVDAKGQYGFRPKDTLTARLGKGFTIRPVRYEVWGNAKFDRATGTIDVTVSPPRNPPAMLSLVRRLVGRILDVIFRDRKIRD